MYFMERERERERCMPELALFTPLHRNALSHALVEEASKSLTLTTNVGRSWSSNAYYADVY